MLVYFTFGSDHLDNTGQSLYYTVAVIDAVDEDVARKQMFDMRGGLWAFSYPDIPRCQPTIEKLTSGRYNVINVKDPAVVARLRVLH